MKVLITGANGFIGRNLAFRLRERGGVEAVSFTRESTTEDLAGALSGVDFVFHLAGVNRPLDVSEFGLGNRDLTRRLCEAVQRSGRQVPILFSSSIQADRDNPYGVSKREAEAALIAHSEACGSPVHIFRLPNVFGKWCRPNYNSAVATFCHNITRDLPIQINDASAPVSLVYVDDVVKQFVEVMEGRVAGDPYCTVEPEYKTTVGQLAEQVRAFKASRETMVTERVGTGLTRALHATYLSYLPPVDFAYSVPQHGDQRGVFVEMLKTPDCGQFSFFTAHPGITRGGHYHHSKTEKFLVIKGEARFRFRNILNGEFHELNTSGAEAKIVETVPGWTHDITNVGSDELVVMLWANEIFDRARPDTYNCPL